MAESVKAVAYSRVSTEDQGLSLEAQKNRLAEYCQRQGYELVAHYADNGQSGSIAIESRPGASQAIADLQEGRAEVLIATEPDRLSRRLDVLNLYADLEGLGARVEYTDSTNPDMSERGYWSTVMPSLVAVYERMLIAKRIKKALAQKKLEGYRLGSPVSEATRLAGPTVQALRSEGLTYQAIADRLNQEGLKTARGLAWSAGTVRNCWKSYQFDLEAEQARADYLAGF